MKEILIKAGIIKALIEVSNSTEPQIKCKLSVRL
jgi:hypothetical protein